MSTYNDPRCRVDNLRRFDEKQLFVLGAELYDPGNISCFMFFTMDGYSRTMRFSTSTLKDVRSNSDWVAKNLSMVGIWELETCSSVSRGLR